MIDLDSEDLFEQIYDLVWDSVYQEETIYNTSREIIEMLKRKAQDEAD